MMRIAVLVTSPDIEQHSPVATEWPLILYGCRQIQPFTKRRPQLSLQVFTQRWTSGTGLTVDYHYCYVIRSSLRTPFACTHSQPAGAAALHHTAPPGHQAERSRILFRIDISMAL